MAELNLEQITKLIAALERDVANLPTGTPAVQRLRDEVAALKNTIDASAQHPDEIHSGLSGVHTALNEVAVDGIKVGQYVAQIGRLLGL